MNKSELQARSKQFALRVMNLVDALPNSTKGRVIGNQLLRSATAVGANYRACCRARSRAEFIAKIGIVAEEADESAFSLELIVEGKILSETKIRPLLKEANELVAIMSASRISASRSEARAKRLDSTAASSQSTIGNLQSTI